MHGLGYAYGFWGLVIFNVGLFLFFILSFMTPKGKGEWRSMGVTTAFFVALFTEMYGFPLTIYILAALFGHSYPAVNPCSHASGHLLVTVPRGRGRHADRHSPGEQRPRRRRVYHHVEGVEAYPWRGRPDGD